MPYKDKEKQKQYLKEWNKKQYNPSTRVARETQRERFIRLKAEGRCGWCGEQRTDFKELCNKCNTKRNERQKRYTHKCKQLHKCSSCTKPTNGETNLCTECRAFHSHRIKTYNKTLKLAAFYAYGGPKCVCCGESHELLLTIDHINGGGSRHRKDTNNAIYKWLKDNNYPEGFQVLCWNCNMGKHLNGGVCPHKELNP
jgi:hypothetical protein